MISRKAKVTGKARFSGADWLWVLIVLSIISGSALLVPLSGMAQTGPQTSRITPPVPTTAPAVVVKPQAPNISARSHILMDFHSGAVLSEHDPQQRLDPASITKIMTSYVVFQELHAGGLTLDEMVTISEKAWGMGGSKMFIEVGKQVSIEDLIRGLVVQSGNDASVALAEHIAGTESAFAGLMNQYAERLGMYDTHYVNATGLTGPEHYTTAADVALLSQALIRDFPEQYAYYAEHEFTFNDIRQSNRNLLLFRDDRVDGIKTGHTDAAGYCLAASSLENGMRLVSVVMGTNSEAERAEQTQALLNYGHRFYETVQLYQQGEQPGRMRVWRGAEAQVGLQIANDVHLTIPRGRYGDLVARMELQEPLEAPVQAGQILGNIVVSLDDEVLLQQPLTAVEGVGQGNFLKRWWHGMRLRFRGDDDDE